MAERLLARLRAKRMMRRVEPLLGLLVFLVRDASAMGGQPGGQQQGSALGLFLPLLLMFVVLYYFMIRPAQKRQKAKDRMLAALKKGDRIVTSGGLYGDILQVKEHTVVVRIADNVKVELQRSSVSSVLGGEESAKEAT